MATLWAKIVSGLLSLVKPLLALIIYMAGKRAATQEIAAAQAEKEAELEKDWLDNRDNRTPDDTLKRMQDGSF